MTEYEETNLENMLTDILHANDLAQGGGGLHSWRCEYPDLYGKCDCLEYLIKDIMDVLR